MATAVHDVFEEHLGVIAALKDNYTRRDDIVSVENVIALKEEIARICLAREEDVKEAIKELTRHVEKTEQNAVYPKPENAHSEHVSEFQNAIGQARHGVDALNSQLKELEQQREQVRQSLNQLEERKKEVERLREVVEPSIRHKLTLYVHASKILWDLHNIDKIAGTINDPKHKDINNFDLGVATEQQPSFETVNALWDLISNDTTTK